MHDDSSAMISLAAEEVINLQGSGLSNREILNNFAEANFIELSKEERVQILAHVAEIAKASQVRVNGKLFSAQKERMELA